jgi:hypothetical protein
MHRLRNLFDELLDLPPSVRQSRIQELSLESIDRERLLTMLTFDDALNLPHEERMTYVDSLGLPHSVAARLHRMLHSKNTLQEMIGKSVASVLQNWQI